MRRARTRLAALVVTVSATVALAGCGGAAAPPTDTAAPSTDTNGQPVATTSTDPSSTNAAVPTDPSANAAGVGGASPTTGGVAAPAPIPDTVADDVPGLASIAKAGDIFAPQATIVSDDGSDTTTTSTETTESSSTDTGTTTTESKPKVTITYDKATITLDGETFTVTKGATFPKDTGQFQVLAIDATTVTLQLTAGEFTSGAEGIALHTGKTISILNQSEGVSYVLTLESVHHTTSTDAAA